MGVNKLVVCALIVCTFELAAKPVQSHDRFQSDQSLDIFIQELEEKTSRFTSEDFVTSIEQKQISFEERKNAWNEQPLLALQHPLNQNFSVGIYVNDLFKLGFLGLDILYDWYFCHALKNYVAEIVYKTLINNPRPETVGLDEYKESLCTTVHNAIQLSYQELQEPAFILLMTKLSVAQAVIAYGKHELLTNNQEQTSWIEFLTRKLTNRQQALSKPIPLFNLINEHVLTQFAMDNSQGGVIESVNQLFDTLGFMPSLLKYSMTQQIENLAVNILFISWFNCYILSPMISTCIRTQFEQLEPLLKISSNLKQHLYTGGCRLTQTDDRLINLEKKSEETVKSLIHQGLTLSFGTWLTMKNTTLARWKLYRNVIVSLPGWYRIVSGTYDVYKKIMIPL